MTKTLAELSETMRNIDFAMLSTRTPHGAIAARPMSNNRQVNYNGDSFFFTTDDTHTVQDIRRDDQVGLAMQGSSGLLGQRPVFLAIEGKATLIDDRQAFADHWTSDLDRWFAQGVDTPGLVLIQVHAARIHYWDGDDEGELLL